MPRRGSRFLRTPELTLERDVQSQVLQLPSSACHDRCIAPQSNKSFVALRGGPSPRK